MVAQRIWDPLLFRTDGLPHSFFFIDKKAPGASGRFSEDQVASPASSFSLLHFASVFAFCSVFVRFKTNPLPSAAGPPRYIHLHHRHECQHLPAPPTRHPSHQRTNQEHNRHDTISHPPPPRPSISPRAHPSEARTTPAHRTRQVTPPILPSPRDPTGGGPIEKGPAKRGSEIFYEGGGRRGRRVCMCVCVCVYGPGKQDETVPLSGL